MLQHRYTLMKVYFQQCVHMLSPSRDQIKAYKYQPLLPLSIQEVFISFFLSLLSFPLTSERRNREILNGARGVLLYYYFKKKNRQVIWRHWYTFCFFFAPTYTRFTQYMLASIGTSHTCSFEFFCFVYAGMVRSFNVTKLKCFHMHCRN